MSDARTIPLATAYATPPPGGPAIVGVVERRFANGRQQDIALATTSRLDGQNMLRVQVIGVADDTVANRSTLSDAAPRTGTLARDMATSLPGVAMRTSPYFVQNRYGPFGYAAGRAKGGDLCLYAWQRLRAPETRLTVFSRRGAIQIRLRLCDSRWSESELLSVMYGLTINVAVLDPAWNPYGDSPPPPASWGRPGTPVYPTTVVSGAFAEVAPAAPARQPRQATVRTPVSERKVTSEEERSGPVPPPPGASIEGGSVNLPHVIVPPPPGAAAEPPRGAPTGGPAAN